MRKRRNYNKFVRLEHKGTTEVKSKVSLQRGGEFISGTRKWSAKVEGKVE